MNFEKLQQFVDHLTKEKVPGNAVCVYLNGKKVFEYASGYADLENQVPMTGKELLNIYSCSKVTTVTAALQLLEKGAFLLSDPLYEYIPEFREMYIRTKDGDLIRAKNAITVGDLFSMTAGMDYNVNCPEIQEARERTNGAMDTLEVARCIAKKPLCFEPGTAWQYSLCHDVLAALVYAISGQKFRDYVKEHIFDPLNMHESYYHHTPEIEQRMACQYRFVPNGANANFDLVEAQKCGHTQNGVFQNVGKPVETYVLGSEYDSGGAGITTSVPDYAKLTAALANNGMGLTGERILSGNTVRLMHTNHLTPQNGANFNWQQLIGYGYGLGVRTMIDPAKGGSNGSIGEFGWGGAAGATVLADSNLNLAVFYAHHMLNPQETYYQPRLRNVVYACLDA